VGPSSLSSISSRLAPEAYGSVMAQKTTQSSCGKAIVVGEHAVVYGAEAVALPIRDFCMQATVTPLPSSSPDTLEVIIGGHAASPLIRGAVQEALVLLQIPSFPLSITGIPHLPVGAGLGGSASLCVVILKALAAAVGQSLSPKVLAQYAHQLEARFHGTPSGLDTAVVAYEQPISFIKGEAPRPIHLPSGQTWHFAIIDSGTRASTRMMIQQVAPFFQGSLGEARLEQFNRLAKDTRQGFQQGCVDQIGTCMIEAQRLLQQAGVIPSLLQEIIAITQQVGTLAAKVTGAGGGGCILTLLDPAHKETQLLALQQAFTPARVFSVTI
jgi:mevalonate kinase